MKPNRQIILAARPRGMVRETDLSLVVSDVNYPGNGMLLVRTLLLSVDPYMRSRMDDGHFAFALHEPIRGGGVGVVEESGVPLFKKGDLVTGMFNWADHTVVKADEAARLFFAYGAPLAATLGVLGMTGLTAYFGMLEVGQPQKGETALISAAAGAVGSVAGQIARIKGCRIVGITGSDEKARIVREEFGFDDAINYNQGDLDGQIDKKCPQGVDIYFDNVGGDITDVALSHLNQSARIVICGQISLYNLQEASRGPRPFPMLLRKSALARGLLVHQHADHFEEARVELSTWVNDGLLRHRETIISGLENAPRALIGLFKGENIGKLIIKVADE